MRAIVQPIIYDFSEKSESPSPPKRKRLFKPEEFKDIIRESESEEQESMILRQPYDNESSKSMQNFEENEDIDIEIKLDDDEDSSVMIVD